jgi:glycosyltransferase involved in cell wall biosynthesis
MRKKVVIIAYYWPPAGGPGVQRWLKFIKYLPDFQVDPIVYVPQNPNYPIEDTSLLKEVPSSITILKQPIVEPYKWASIFSKKQTKRISSGIITQKKQSVIERLLLWIRGNFFIPDARKYWIKPSVAYLESYLQENSIDAIITTGPPHSLHVIGKQLKERTGVKWLADFRDPWTTIGYHKHLKLTKRAAKKHKLLEKQVLDNADKILTTSFTTASDFRQLTNTAVEVITNGYDITTEAKPTLDTKFSLSHIGSLLSERNPEVLWKVLAELCQESKDFAKDLQLKLIGTVSDAVIESITQHGLFNYTEIVGYQPHDKVRSLQRASQVLLLLEINSIDTRGIIPGKLFEYMASERPILAIGPKDWDVQQIIAKTNTGNVFEYHQHSELKEKIQSLYNDYRNNALKVHAIGLQQYSRKALTKQLANTLLLM